MNAPPRKNESHRRKGMYAAEYMPLEALHVDLGASPVGSVRCFVSHTGGETRRLPWGPLISPSSNPCPPGCRPKFLR
jgi:hypothetical protein